MRILACDRGLNLAKEPSMNFKAFREKWGNQIAVIYTDIYVQVYAVETDGREYGRSVFVDECDFLNTNKTTCKVGL